MSIKRFKRTRSSGGFSVFNAFRRYERLSFIPPLVRAA